MRLHPIKDQNDAAKYREELRLNINILEKLARKSDYVLLQLHAKMIEALSHALREYAKKEKS